CLPVGLDEDGTSRLDSVIGRRRRIARDEQLYRVDQPFSNLYAVHFGHFKTSQINRGGEQQVTGFQMAGDVMGLDAIAAGRHACTAVALEDSEVCEIPYVRLQELFTQVPALMPHFHRIMSREILREQDVMLFLGKMRAEQRLALFLSNLA